MPPAAEVSPLDALPLAHPTVPAAAVPPLEPPAFAAVPLIPSVDAAAVVSLLVVPAFASATVALPLVVGCLAKSGARGDGRRDDDRTEGARDPYSSHLADSFGVGCC
jgi:hypothetical protein